MSEEDPQVAEFFDQYDDLALAVIEDQRPNIQNGMEVSNAEMVEIICDMMDWEFFDLFTPYDFEDAYKNGSMNQILAHCYIAYLRCELFHSARQEGVGDFAVNQYAGAFSEYWYMKLSDKYDAMYIGESTSHSWVH